MQRRLHHGHPFTACSSLSLDLNVVCYFKCMLVLRAASEIGKVMIGSLMGKFIVPVCFSSHSRLKPSIYVFRVLEVFTSVLPSLFSNKRE